MLFLRVAVQIQYQSSVFVESEYQRRTNWAPGACIYSVSKSVGSCGFPFLLLWSMGISCAMSIVDSSIHAFIR